MNRDHALCQENSRLLEAYQKAVTQFSVSMIALREASIEDCDRLRSYSEQARLGSERARLAWEAHRLEHGCHPSPFG